MALQVIMYDVFKDLWHVFVLNTNKALAFIGKIVVNIQMYCSR